MQDECSKTVAKNPPITMKMDRLYGIISELSDVLGNLESKLIPVLGTPVPTPACIEKGKAVEVNFESNMTIYLAEQYHRVELVVERITDLLARCEL